ncbi:hypothetical protein E3N88_39942 [Mikania micrantha]|uniref:HAT C-terminal dimerisation domain-containing protein n=1 Tax=Mikania micrantha TaxID=192012 RepID=A0A5N6LL74_9ASTR|nr:hypothetical protein E3N88_39942 [Mikania micrantha]
MAALSPRDSFANFDKSKLLQLSEFYPHDFGDGEKIMLDHQLGLYRHSALKDPNLLTKMLALVLPVATATVERCFSAMKRVKSSLRNRIGDDFLNA